MLAASTTPKEFADYIKSDIEKRSAAFAASEPKK